MASASSTAGGLPANVADLLGAAADAFPDRPAVLSAGADRTWQQLDRAADAGVAVLRDAGLHPGDRVLLSLPTGPDLLAALFAVTRAGLVAVPVQPQRADLDAIVARVGARAAIAARPPSGVDVGLLAGELTSWWQSAHPAAVEVGAAGPDLAVLARAAADRPVMVSHRAILAAVAAITAVPRLRLRADDRAILVLPSYHLAGWVTAFLPLCSVGAAGVVPDPPTPDLAWIDAVLLTISGRRVTVVPGAPSLYRRLRAAQGVERALASVRLMTSAAAPLDAGDFSAIRVLTGQPVWEGYGVSESASVVSSSLMTASARPGSVGRPLTGVRLRIVGDDGIDLYAGPPAAADGSPGALDRRGDAEDPAAGAGAGGEVGRIQIAGPTLFSGYWPGGVDGPDAQGWFATGDLGYLDDLGELHLVDRVAETIRVAGFPVYPREIENVLTGHPFVRDAAVIGVPGPAGDLVVAVLVPLRGTHPTASDLEEFVADRLPAFKRPRRYLLVDRLPRNEIGRIDRTAVRSLYRGDDAIEPLAAERRAPVPADVSPEAAAPLAELGSRLPGTGERDRRAQDDTDDDLF